MLKFLPCKTDGQWLAWQSWLITHIHMLFIWISDSCWLLYAYITVKYQWNWFCLNWHDWKSQEHKARIYALTNMQMANMIECLCCRWREAVGKKIMLKTVIDCWPLTHNYCVYYILWSLFRFGCFLFPTTCFLAICCSLVGLWLSTSYEF